ncbi:LuxR family transcriptional regulator [Stenotrophomonas terrae]|uniref:LuxR family transcriptional regulator n=1 Tax=Stenotrophomonas terrae TaxID=405446 RepID=A0A0R0CE96_9GAMM|nr:response regulator transcription factor [Stenotrophomonas terrae]KRG67701.1 LuxR family transcriptional regulator [Stenotrophomonas terrae]
MNGFKIKVILADDHPGMIAGVKYELSSIDTIELVGTAADSTELMALLNSVACDVVVSDYAMPAGDFGDGIALFGMIARRYPQVKLVVLTMLDNPAVLHTLLTQGVMCIVSKSDALTHLVPAVHAAHSGGKYYSPTIEKVVQGIELNRRSRNPAGVLSIRESEVVRLYASGLTVNEIAERLHRSKKTISTQKANAMEKLSIEKDVDLLRYAMENGLVTSSGGVPAAPEPSGT